MIFNAPQEHQNPCYSANGPRAKRPNTSSELGVDRSGLVGVEGMLKGIGDELSRNIDVNTLIKRDVDLVNQYENATKML